MEVPNDQIKGILINVLDACKEGIDRQQFSNKVVDGVVMVSMPIKPTRPELPAGVLMLAISEKHDSIDEIAGAFDSWGTKPSS